MKKRLALVDGRRGGCCCWCAAAPALAARRPTPACPTAGSCSCAAPRHAADDDRAFHAWQASPACRRTVVDDNKTPDDPADDLTYTGIALLAPRRPHRRQPSRRRFNETLATSARLQRRRPRRGRLHGHVHERRGRDAEGHAGRRGPHERLAAHARHRLHQEPGDGRRLEAQLAAKLVSSDPGIFGSRKPAGVVRISIVPASDDPRRRRRRRRTAGSCSCAAPSAAVTTYAFRAWSARPAWQGDRRRRQQDARRPDRRPHLHGRLPVAARGPHRRQVPRQLQRDARHHRARATTCVVTGVDGFSATYTSAEVATLKDTLVVADRMNGSPLTLGTASIKNRTGGRRLEAQLAAQAGLERRHHLRQPQAGRHRPHQHRAGGPGSAPF